MQSEYVSRRTKEEIMAKNLGLHKSETWLRQRYVMEGKTLAEMSKEAGVSIEMINRSLRKFGVK